MPTINYLSPNELFIDWDELSLSEYQISHYMVNVTINSSSEIIVANVASTNINVTPGDSVSVLVAAVDEAGRQGEFSDDSQFDNTCECINCPCMQIKITLVAHTCWGTWCWIGQKIINFLPCPLLM